MTRRTQRVGEAMREALGRIVQLRVKDPRIGFVTITAVRVTPDLSRAYVYYTVLGGAEERQATQEGLESATPFLRTEVGRHVRLKTLPELEFHFDEAVEHGRRIDELLTEVHEEEGPAGDVGDATTWEGAADEASEGPEEDVDG